MKLTLPRIYRTAMCAVALSATAGVYPRDYSNWMAELPGDAYVTTLSIPGTHDSATGHGFTSSITGSFSQTQDKTIAEQLEMGVRAFDFRPGRGNAGNIFKPNYRLRCFHGSAEIKYWYDDAIRDICSWLDNHPDELVIIHLYKATDNTNKDLDALFESLIAEDAVAPHIADFRPDLTVDQMRGKILFLKRYVVDWGNSRIAWLWDWNETDWATSEMYVKNGGYEEHRARIIMQDKANTSPDDKIARVRNLLDYSVTYAPASNRDMVWMMNFASSYNGSVSSSKTYCENASKVNPAIIGMLDEVTGPTGIVMLDWVGDNQHLSGYYTQGETLVHKIADHNFRYIHLLSSGGEASPRFEDISLDGLVSPKLFQGNVVWMDVNNDGHQDLVVKGRDLADGWWPKYQAMINDGASLQAASPLPRTAFENDYDENASRLVVPIDYDADGHIDMIYGCSANSMLVGNDGTGVFAEPTDDAGNRRFTLYGQDINLGGNIEDRGTQGLMLVADFDLDGYPDILTYHSGSDGVDGNPYMFRNESGVFGCAFFGKNSSLPPLKHGSMAIGDYDRDGAPDVLVSGINEDGVSQASICLNRGFDGEWFHFEVVTPTALQPYATDRGAVAMVDVNNDGLLDIFISGRLRDKTDNGNVDRTSYAANIFIQHPDGSLERQYVPSVPVCASGMDWCDIDGDGDIDIVYGGQACIFNGINGSQEYLDAVSVVMTNRGDGTFVCDNAALAPLRSGVSTRVYDYDGSGMASVAMMGYGGDTFHLYRPESASGRRAVSMFTAQDGMEPILEKSDNGKARLSWEGAGDATRYNYVLVSRSGHVHSAVPVNTDTGKLLTTDIDAATTATSVSTSIDYDDIARYGVQAIGPDKKEGRLVLYDVGGTPSGTGVIAADDSDVCPAEYYTLQGIRVDNPSNGIFIEKRGDVVVKRMIP